jgi:large subunit ribosomal protein L4
LDWSEPKTKQAVGVLESLELAGRILLVLPDPTESGTVEKSFRNLSNVKIAYSGGLGTYDILLADRVLFTEAAIDRLIRGPKGTTPESAPESERETPAPEKTPRDEKEVAE